MRDCFTCRGHRAFTLLELLIVVATIAFLVALLSMVITRSKERAKRSKCDAILRQCYLAVRMYADDNEGYVAAYTNFSQKLPMRCPSDKRTHVGLNSSYDASSFIFGSRTRLDDAQPDYWMLVEFEPFHDLSKKRSADPGKWLGRFNVLHADGRNVWTILEQ